MLLAMFLVTSRSFADKEVGTEFYDSVEISLVTFSPHEEIYSLYGHSALRVHDLHANGEDLAFNYGVFNYHQDYFVLRFVFGKTDYELGIASFGSFCKYYQRWGCEVYEQILNLTNTEKRNVMQALAINFRPENRIYRYNFFYDNCATRPRDIIEHHINGRIMYPPHQGKAPSFREMIHAHTVAHPWAAMGNDLLLGVRADMPTTQREQHFLPENLKRDFANAVIQNPDGTQRPLVKEKRQIIAPGIQLVEPEFPLTPTECGIVLLIVSLLIFALEWKRKRTLVWWDALLMLTMGLAGCIILLMFFSEHPTTSTNLQVLLLNPLHLFFIPAVVRRKLHTRYWTFLLVSVLLFYAAGLWQHYAEGMDFLALCLLLRYWSHIKHDK